MMTPSSDRLALPPMLRLGLGRIDRRLRALACVRGLGLAALAMSIIAAAGMAADFTWAMPQAIRMLIWMAWIGAGAPLLIATVFRSQGRLASYSDLAAVAERGNPDLGERLTSAVELLGAKAAPHGSPAFLKALGDDANRRAMEIDPSAAISSRRAVRIAILGMLGAAVVAAPAIVRPDPFRTLAHRFVMPWADIDRVARFVVEVLPGDATTAIGSDVNITATVERRFGGFAIPDSASVEWTGADGEPHTRILRAEGAGSASSRTFVGSLPRVASMLRYRVVAGSAASRSHTITAIAPPSIAQIQARVEPPSYTRIPASAAKNPSRIEAREGSNVAVTITTHAPLTRASLDWPATDPSAPRREPMTSQDGTTWTAKVVAEHSGPYAFHLEDQHALTNRPEPPRRLVVKPDLAPAITMGGSSEPKSAQGDDLLVVEILARDDFAVMTCDLLYTIARRDAQATADESDAGRKSVPLEGLGTRTARGEASLSLKTLGMRPGDALSYQVRVADNRPAPRGPNITITSPRTLKIVENAEPLLARERSGARKSFQDAIDAIKRSATENRQATEALRYAADASQRGNGEWSEARQADLANREAAARSVVEKLHLLSRDLGESSQFATLARPARQIADVEAEGGREKLDAARTATDPTKRLADLRAADDRQTAVLSRLDEFQRAFHELAKLDDDRRKLRELAEAQDDLAARADAIAAGTATDGAAMEALQRDQERLRSQIDEIARRSPELRAEALATRAREADALAKRARALAEQQREEARKTSDPSGRAATLKAIADDQRKLEDDARRLALQVDRPLEENGRARVDTGLLARALDPIEHAEIELARQRLEDAEHALRRLERDLDDVRDDPKSLARRLAKRQDALANQVADIVRQANDPERKAALAGKLKPFAARQDAILELAAALPVPEALQAQANEAVESITRSSEDLTTNQHEHVQRHQTEARDRLHRLADALPDLNARTQQARKAVGDAKSRTDQVAKDLETHLRETSPKPGQMNFDSDAAARDLARRVAPLADRQSEAVKILASLAPDRRSEPQRERALNRARNLADALDALRESGPDETAAAEVRPRVDWRVLGPFDDAKMNPPFAIDRAIDPTAEFKGRKEARPRWKPVVPGDRDRIDLGAMFTRDSDQSAFAYAEIVSPVQGRGRMMVGSDDYLTIWINGKRAYDFNQPREWKSQQDRVEIALDEGPNRVLVRCGNVAADWAFSVALQTPKHADLAESAREARLLRESIPAIAADASASVERLEAKLHGREPADDRAEEIAKEMKTSASAESLRRLAASLRNLKVPDAVAHHREAVQRAALAAAAVDGAAPDATKLRADAAIAADRLARRMADTMTPREQAQALSQAQRGVLAPEAARDARSVAETQDAIAREVAALATESTAKAAAVEAARSAANLATGEAQRAGTPETAARLSEAFARSAKALDTLAEATGNPAPSPVLVGSPRSQAREASARQKGIHAQVLALEERAKTAANNESALANIARELARLGQDQQDLAEEVRGIVNPRDPNLPPHRDSEAHRETSRTAQARAAGAMAAGNAAKARERTGQAIEALDRLAESLPEGDANLQAASRRAPIDPELMLSDEHTREARTLAHRQRDIRERLQAVLGDRVAPQDALRDASTNLGRSLAELRESTREISEKAREPANQAVDLLQNHAPNVMREGSQQLAAGRPDQARETQRRAAEILERAAQHAEDLAGSLRAEAPAETMARAEAAAKSDAEGQAGATTLGAARDAQRQAARDLAQARESSDGATAASASQSASQAMKQAAQGLRAAASPSRASSSVAANDRSDAPSGSPDPTDGAAGRADPNLAALQEAIETKTGRQWGELPGHLRSEILQMSQGKYRDDYARLIGLYFRQIAAGRDDKDPKP